MGGSERSYGGKTASERVAERRERLVEAAVAVLARSGEAHATMTAICAEAGLTERYFYESFTSLDDALLAALDSVCEEIIALAAETMERTGGSPEERVHAVMVAFVDLVQRAPDKVSVAVLHAQANPRLRARRHELLGVFADFVARESVDLYGDSAWPAERARIHGLVYIAGFAELVASWMAGEVRLTDAELVDTAGDLFAALTRRTET